MIFLISSLLLFLVGSLFSFLCRRENTKKLMGLGGVIVGSLVGLVPAIRVLSGQAFITGSISGTIPDLTFRVGVDSLSAFFLVPLLGLSAFIAFYAWGYFKGQTRLLASLPFFPLLVASMVAVVVSLDGFLFLIVWEIMSLASFFLVTAEHEQRDVRHAGWMYFATTHLATAFLLVFFALLFKETGSFAFRDFLALRSTPFTNFLFFCAVIGFGTKAGVFPFHVWLPHAHPAAPSYISALMSGAMIKVGIYGLLRTLTFFPHPPLWWGELLMVVGIASIVVGILYALMQHDLKKLLAYSSVENIGIIVSGIGLGLVGRHAHHAAIELLGFGSALLHVVNHTIFKGLLFLGTGNIVHATHTKRIDLLGGLLRNMPWTAATFFVASAAICGLPLLNGFMSEWLLYVGFFEGVKVFAHSSFFFCAASVVSIAFAGGLAVVCFTKVCGAVFLGHPRWSSDHQMKEGTWQQCFPLGMLAILCFLLGLFPQLIFPWCTMVLADFGLVGSFDDVLPSFMGFTSLNVVFGFLIGFVLLGILIRDGLFSGKTKRVAPTWDCGFHQPTKKMQYTASSYAEPLSVFFGFLLKPLVFFKKTGGIFFQKASFERHVEDLSERMLFSPLAYKVTQALSFMRRQQRSHIQHYLAYIFVSLLLLLLWEVWIGI